MEKKDTKIFSEDGAKKSPEIVNDLEILFRKSIPKYRKLSREEEADFAKRIEAGDESATHEFTLLNLPLVVKIVRSYSLRFGSHLKLLDIIQEGVIGLLEAVKKFDYTKGIKFSTFATLFIRKEISAAFANQNQLIGTPSWLFIGMAQYSREFSKLRNALGRVPSIKEMADKLGESEKHIKLFEGVSKQSYQMSLSPPDDDNQSSGLDVHKVAATTETPEAIVSKTFAITALYEIIATLDTMEQKVIWMRFGLDDGVARTRKEIGEELVLPEDSIRSIEAKAMKKFRQHPLFEKLKGY